MYTVIFNREPSTVEAVLASFADPEDALEYCDRKTEDGMMSQDWNDEMLVIQLPSKKRIMPYELNAIICLTPRPAWEAEIKRVAW